MCTKCGAERVVGPRKDHGTYQTFDDFVKIIQRVADHTLEPVYVNNALGPGRNTSVGNAASYRIAVEPNVDQFSKVYRKWIYRQTSNIRRTFEGNKITQM